MDKNCADSLRVGHWSWPCLSIMGVLNGLSEAPQQGLSPLGSVGTDIIVTTTVGAVTSASTTSTTNPVRTQGIGQGGEPGGSFRSEGALRMQKV